MLEKAALIRASTLYTELLNDDTRSTAERELINTLTAIARQLLALLGSGATDGYETGAERFCLFSFSQATDYEGQPAAWDLGSYLRDVAGRLPKQDPSTKISMRRLISVLRELRPLCAQRDDLRAAWERIGLAPDDDYQESFWDAQDFELGPILDPEAHVASVDRAPSHEEITSGDAAPSHKDSAAPAVLEEWSTLHWLDAAMR